MIQQIWKTDRFIAFLLLVLYLPVSLFSLSITDKTMHSLARKSIEAVYRQDFDQAERESKKLIKKYPNHPVGYFFYAAVLESRMKYYGTDKDETEFYKYCDIAISKGEKLQNSSSNDPWTIFFLAGAHGAKGTHETRYGRWITAFKNGWQGVAMLKKMVKIHPDFSDAYYGIAVYEYWRSAMTATLWWMPGVEDKREESIQTLQKILSSALYVSEEIALELIAILCNEKQFDEALKLSNQMLIKYPGNISFMWGRVEAQIGLHALTEALADLKFIKKEISSDSEFGTYVIFKGYYNEAKIYYQLKKRDACIDACTQALNLPLDSVTKKRLEKQIAEVAKMSKKAKSYK